MLLLVELFNFERFAGGELEGGELDLPFIAACMAADVGLRSEGKFEFCDGVGTGGGGIRGDQGLGSAAADE